MSEAQETMEFEETSSEDKFFGVKTTIGSNESQSDGGQDSDFEIELVDDRPEEDRRPPKNETVSEDISEEELSSYSEKVQKRINKLRYDQHEERRRREEAEKMREEAVRYAQQVTEKNKEYESLINRGETALIGQIKDKAKLSYDTAKEMYRKAYEEGDTDNVVAAQEKLIKAQTELSEAEKYENNLARTAQQQPQAFSQTLQSQRQAAGSSGAAALAQAIAGVQSQNLQAASASIGQQESAINQQRASQAFTLQGAVASEAALNQQRAMAQEVANQRAVAGEAAAIQGLGVEAQFLGAQQQQARDLTTAQMDFTAQQIRAQGADLVQMREFDRDSTLLGIQAQRTAGAGADLQNLYSRRADILGSVIGGVGSAAEGAGNALAASLIASDRRLKKNIKFLTKSNKGFNVYTFEYKNKKYGDGIYQGVMSDEIPKENIIINKDGYDMVNYSNLDVEFKRI